jgi:hypothetical protein
MAQGYARAVRIPGVRVFLAGLAGLLVWQHHTDGRGVLADTRDRRRSFSRFAPLDVLLKTILRYALVAVHASCTPAWTRRELRVFLISITTREDSEMTKLLSSAMAIMLVGSTLPIAITVAGDAPFPKKIFTQPGSPPEGFTIGKGTTAYQGALDGSIFKSDLRSGKGELLVDVVEPWTLETCRLLGLRVDDRTNYLFAAGC